MESKDPVDTQFVIITTMKKLHLFLGLALAGLILIAGAFIHLRYNTFFIDIVGSDDAFISYRYAENFFKGHGLVFNPGERVEGYSNLLYTLLMVPAFFIGKAFVYSYSFSLNILFGLAALLVFCGFIVHRYGQRHALLGGLLFSANPILWLHINTGLESILVLLWQLIGWTSMERYLENKTTKKHLYFLLTSIVLLLVTRVDGFIFAGILVFYLLFFRREYWTALFTFLTTVVVESMYIALRYAYYGDVLNNAYYAKVSGTLLTRLQHGLQDFITIVFHSGIWPYVIVFGLTIVLTILGYYRSASAIKRKSLVWPFPIVGALCLIAYWIFIGGDVFHERFLLLLYPLGIFLLVALLQKYTNTVFAVITTLVFVVFGLNTIGDNEHLMYATNGPQYDMWITLGQYLKEHEPQSTLAVDAAGKIPFFSELYTTDMLGLNDKHIAKKDASNVAFIVGHNKFDPDYILAKKPDLISAWITDGLDMYWGMTQQKYQDSYHVKYLLSGGNVINVEGQSNEAIASLIRQGFNYGVLAKTE